LADNRSRRWRRRCRRCFRALHKTGHALALAFGNQRTDFVFGIVRAIELQGRGSGGEIGDQIVVQSVTGIDAAGRGAILSGIVEAEGAQAAYHVFEIGIVEHDHRRLAAEL
jgi:hypothetical protein